MKCCWAVCRQPSGRFHVSILGGVAWNDHYKGKYMNSWNSLVQMTIDLYTRILGGMFNKMPLLKSEKGWMVSWNSQSVSDFGGGTFHKMPPYNLYICIDLLSFETFQLLGVVSEHFGDVSGHNFAALVSILRSNRERPSAVYKMKSYRTTHRQLVRDNVSSASTLKVY